MKKIYKNPNADISVFKSKDVISDSNEPVKPPVETDNNELEIDFGEQINTP